MPDGCSSLKELLEFNSSALALFYVRLEFRDIPGVRDTANFKVYEYN